LHNKWAIKIASTSVFFNIIGHGAPCPYGFVYVLYCQIPPGGIWIYDTISNPANFAINLLCPAFSKLISTFKSSPSASTEFIIPSPNFL